MTTGRPGGPGRGGCAPIRPDRSGRQPPRLADVHRAGRSDAAGGALRVRTRGQAPARGPVRHPGHRRSRRPASALPAERGGDARHRRPDASGGGVEGQHDDRQLGSWPPDAPHGRRTTGRVPRAGLALSTPRGAHELTGSVPARRVHCGGRCARGHAGDPSDVVRRPPRSGRHGARHVVRAARRPDLLRPADARPGRRVPSFRTDRCVGSSGRGTLAGSPYGRSVPAERRESSMGTSKWRTIRPAVGTPGLVELPVTDLERATYFYTTLFPQWVPAEYALGRSRLIETAGDTLIALERHDDDAGLLKPLIYFRAHDLDATL